MPIPIPTFARSGIFCRAALLVACCGIALCHASPSAYGQDHNFLEDKWKPLLAQLVKARKLELGSANQPGARLKAAQAFDQAGSMAQVYLGFKRVREWPDGGMRDRPAFAAGPVNDSRPDPFVPRLAAAYAYFQAARLYEDPQKKELLYARAAGFLELPKNGRFMDVYGANTFQKIALLGELERNRALAIYHPKDRTVAFQNIQKTLEQLNTLLQQAGGPAQNNAALQKEQDRLGTAANILSALDADDPKKTDDAAIGKFIQDVDAEIAKRVDWPQFAQLQTDDAKTAFHATIASLQLPVAVIVRDSAGKEVRVQAQDYDLTAKLPGTEAKVTLEIPQDSALYKVCKRLHPESSILSRTIAAPIGPITQMTVFIGTPQPVQDAAGTVKSLQFTLQPGKPDQVAAVEYQILDSRDQPVGPPIKQLYDPNRSEIAISTPLPPGTYALTAKVYGSSADPAKPLGTSVPERFTVLSPKSGMVFIVAIDNYFQQSLPWMCDGAEELTQKLIALGYDPQNIIRIYGRVHAPQHPEIEQTQVIIEPADFRARLEKTYAGLSDADNPLKLDYITWPLLSDAFDQFTHIALNEKQTQHLLIYFGGHGEGRDKGQDDLLLLPLGTDNKLSVNLWPEQLLSASRSSASNLTVVGMFDACRTSAAPGEVNINGDPKQFCIYRSCKDSESSYTDDKQGTLGIRHSFFANALLMALAQVKSPADMDAERFFQQMSAALDATEQQAKLKNWSGQQDLPPLAGNGAALPLLPALKQTTSATTPNP